MNCNYLNQRNYNLEGQLKGVRCTRDATEPEKGTGALIWCKVHSYTADRKLGAGSGPGYVPTKGDKVTINGYLGTITEIHTDIRKGMVDVRLDRGEVTVDIKSVKTWPVPLR